MIAPIKHTFGKKAIKLLPQEKEGNCKFNGPLVATPAAIENFGAMVINITYVTLRVQARVKGGLDYLQVFEIDGDRLWFIDDVSHVTALLPEDY